MGQTLRKSKGNAAQWGQFSAILVILIDMEVPNR
jgi:hypothetical protein